MIIEKTKRKDWSFPQIIFFILTVSLYNICKYFPIKGKMNQKNEIGKKDKKYFC